MTCSRKKNLIESLNPLTKVAFLVCLTLNVFLNNSAVQLVLLFACGLALLAHVERSLNSLKTVVLLLIVSLPLNAAVFAVSGLEGSADAYAGLAGGLRQCLLFMLKIGVLFAANFILVRSTSIKDMTAALKLCGFPPKAVIFITTIIRFIPLSIDEIKRIYEVQKARGLKLSRIRNVSAVLAILVPLIVVQLKKANDIALALEIRHFCWSSGNSLRSGFGWRDMIGCCAAALMVILR